MIEFKSGLITVKVISRNESRMMSRHFLKVFVTCWARSQRADFTFMLGTDLKFFEINNCDRFVFLLLDRKTETFFGGREGICQVIIAK